MEGNGYLLPLRNAKRYTPYEFDRMMSKNENRMDTLGKILDTDIYNCMMADRRTPLILTPKLILDNNNGIDAIRPPSKTNNLSQSQQILRNPLSPVLNDSFKIPQSPHQINSIQRQKYINLENNTIRNDRYMPSNDEFNQFEPKQEMNPQNMRYEENPRYTNEKRYFLRRTNHRDDEPVKINQNDYANKNYGYPEQKYNNNLRSQEIPINRNNYNMERRRPTPYNEEYNDRKINSYDAFNNDNYDERNKEEFKNRNLRAFSPKNNDNTIQKNEDLNNNLSYIRRGYYNSQLNFPYDRYEN